MNDITTTDRRRIERSLLGAAGVCSLLAARDPDVPAFITAEQYAGTDVSEAAQLALDQIRAALAILNPLDHAEPASSMEDAA